MVTHFMSLGAIVLLEMITYIAVMFPLVSPDVAGVSCGAMISISIGDSDRNTASVLVPGLC